MKSSFLDQLSAGIAEAITDIREKVVEEPWYGKALTDREQVPGWGSEMRQAEVSPPEKEREPEIEL